ncbi:glutathione S-transferase family protein [Massilia kyonggiensis]
MQLYYNHYSSNTRRVLLAADHLGIEFDLIQINLASQDDRRRLGEVNPNAKLPVLIDGDFILWESCAIMQYLAEGTPGQTVWPQERRARADVSRWMFWACQHFAPAIGVFTWEHLWKKFVTGQDADPKEVARGEADLAEAARVLDQHLATRRWLAGDGVTLADYAVAAPLMYKDRAHLPLDADPHLLAWFERVQALPAWQRTTHEW